MGWYPHNPKMGQDSQTDVASILAERAFVVRYSWTAAQAAAASATAVHAAFTLEAAAKEVTTGFTNPPTPRSLTVTGNQAGVAGNVVITGTNILDEVITETIVAAGNTTVEGAHAFKTVTKVKFPALVGAGDTISVGTGSKLGLPYKLSRNTVAKAYLANTVEGTAPTVTVSATVIDSNTVDLNSALNGTAVDVYLMIP